MVTILNPQKLFQNKNVKLSNQCSLKNVSCTLKQTQTTSQDWTQISNEKIYLVKKYTIEHIQRSF